MGLVYGIKKTMNIVIGILLFCLGSIVTIGLLAPSGGDNQPSASNAVRASSVNANTPAATATPPYTGVFQYCEGSFQVTDPSKGGNVVVISIYINNTGDETYSVGTGDWVIEINNRTYNSYISGDFETSDKNNGLNVSPGNQGFATYAYRVDDKLVVGSPLKLIYKGLNNTSRDVCPCTIQSLVDQSTTIHKMFSTVLQVTNPTSASEPEKQM